jgi:hypothetical protein
MPRLALHFDDGIGPQCGLSVKGVLIETNDEAVVLRSVWRA